MALFAKTTIACLLHLAYGHNPHDVIGALGASPDGNVVFAIVRRVMYRSVDGGFSWDAATRGLAGKDDNEKLYRTIAVSPDFDVDSTLFHANALGLWRSSDAGLGWEHVQTESQFDVPDGRSMIAMSPTFKKDHKLLVAVTPAGSSQLPLRLMRSEDKGDNFHEVLKLPRKLATKTVSLLSTNDIVFCATGNGFLTWSMDFGDTWGSEDFANGPTYKGLDVKFNSIETYILEQSNRFYPKQTHEAGWKFSSLLVGTPTVAHVLVFAYKIGGESTDFKVISLNTMDNKYPRYVAMVGAAHSDGHSTVLVVPSLGGDVFRSDNARDFKSHQVIKDRPDLGNWKTQATANGAPVLSHYVSTKRGSLFMGTYCGVHKSIDGGANWVKLDVETRRITQLAVAPGRNDNEVQIATCSYDNGCFGAIIDVPQLKAGNTKNSVKSKVQWNEERYCTMEFSPNYAKDGIALRRCMGDAHNKNSFMWRTADHGRTFNKVMVDMLGGHVTQDGYPAVGGIFTMSFSPNFANDSLVYVGGVDMGVAVSEDQGKQWKNLWKADGKSTKVYISPDFANDKTILVLAAKLFHKKGMDFSGFNSWLGNDIYMSTDAGQTWRKKKADQQVESIYFSPTFAKDRTIIGLRMIDDLTTRLIKSTDGGNLWSDVHPGFQEQYSNFGRGGIALSDNGAAIVSYLDGGAVVGPLSDILNAKPLKITQTKGSVAPFNFVQDTDSDLDVRITQDMVGFSPNFKHDRVIFGCSFYTLYASVDHGVTWQVVFKLGHTNTDCDVSDCVECHVKNRRECVRCRKGYEPNGVTGACSAVGAKKSGLFPGASAKKSLDRSQQKSKVSIIVPKSSSLLATGGTPRISGMASSAAASRWFLELLSVLGVVTLAAYAAICRLWAFYACKQHKQSAESRRQAAHIQDAVLAAP